MIDSRDAFLRAFHPVCGGFFKCLCVSSARKSIRRAAILDPPPQGHTPLTERSADLNSGLFDYHCSPVRVLGHWPRGRFGRDNRVGVVAVA